MDVTRGDAQAIEVFGQLLGHAFGEGGYENPIALLNGCADFANEVVHLVGTGTHVNGGVEQTGGSNDLLDNDALRFFQLVVRRGCGYVDHLVRNAVEFIGLQWTVVQCRGKAETVFYQGGFSRTVAPEHGANLRYGHVAFVNDQQEVVCEIVQQAERALARFAPIEVTAVVLDAIAEAYFLDHFQIIQGAFFQSLGFQVFCLFGKKVLLLFEVLLDFPHGLIRGGFARHE